MNSKSSGSRVGMGMVLGALGVVYGDIGTSPLYALRECFHGPHAMLPTHDNVLGVLSLIFWSLLLIVSLKYLTFVMRADNKGEGGILALLSLAFPEHRAARRTVARYWLVMLGVFGAGLLYGDGMITPAITVLGAVEGLSVATAIFDPYIIPTAVVILVALFSVQRFGTGNMGRVFGPVMAVWFLSLAALGVAGVVKAPEVIKAINPLYAARLFSVDFKTAFVVLGAVFLVLTGGEALYADMGHFGRRPIQRAWFVVVLPSLFLNYLGQGALLLGNPEAAENPFYLLAPSWALYPLVGLATAAAVIASQALISGAFSLTMQAIQLGYSPRLQIDHTSSAERGQIYVPQINWALMIACIGLVVGFGSSSNLAAAYGIAVSLTMIITTVLLYYAARRLWRWGRAACTLLCGFFLVIEFAFCGANCVKIAHGGWFPLVMGAVIFTLMSTWKTGRGLLGLKLQKSSLPLDLFLADVQANPPVRVSGTSVFLSGNSGVTPLALLHNLKHNKVLHQRVIVLTVVTEEVPHVPAAERVEIKPLHSGFWRVLGRYGFMEDPHVPELLEGCRALGLEFNMETTTFFLSRETIIPTRSPGMAIWRERLFAILARNAQPATAFFRLPANRVVELGMQVEV